jgi:hypothetical protein
MLISNNIQKKKIQFSFNIFIKKLRSKINTLKLFIVK